MSHNLKIGMNSGDWNGWAYAIDFIFRITEGLLIYQSNTIIYQPLPQS